MGCLVGDTRFVLAHLCRFDPALISSLFTDPWYRCFPLQIVQIRTLPPSRWPRSRLAEKLLQRALAIQPEGARPAGYSVRGLNNGSKGASHFLGEVKRFSCSGSKLWWTFAPGSCTSSPRRELLFREVTLADITLKILESCASTTVPCDGGFQQSLAADRVQHLQQLRPQQLLRRNPRWPSMRKRTCPSEWLRQLSKYSAALLFGWARQPDDLSYLTLSPATNNSRCDSAAGSFSWNPLSRTRTGLWIRSSFSAAC